MHRIAVVAICWIALLWPSTAAAQEDPFQTEASKPQSCERLFAEGKYQEAINSANQKQEALGRFGIDESLPIIIARSQMRLGQYAEAMSTIEAGLERYENSIRIRWLGQEVAKYNRDVERTLSWNDEIESLAKRSAWRFRDNPNQIVLGQYYLSRGADAKQVLKSFYQPALKRNAADPEVYRAIGQLSLDKGDFGLAAENFLKVIKILPYDSDAFQRLAECYQPSDADLATTHLEKALEINPRHPDSLLMVIDRRLSAEEYPEAQKLIGEMLKVNSGHPQALAYQAVLAHLDNNVEREFALRQQALKHWPGNPGVDHIIGRELSEKYRFREGQKYQRRALVLDESFLPAKIQLAHDLLRLGQELEGWKLADEVFDRDQYNVLAHNLLTLRDEMSSFRTLTRDGFVVRMSTREADIYGDRVLDLLTRASQKLTEKYKVELETPIVIEIFPRQRDFAIRTFGLPGGAGFLGVCFGRVITMNSPSAQGANLTSWESVLWHEFCHVVTLQKTHNRMPRWLSEGISVYEEKLADPAWGESMSQRYRTMLLEELTPISQLSGAFMRPPSPVHLQFAYYESSLVIEYVIAKHGLPVLLAVLDELSIGTPINQALAEHVEPIEALDRNFQAFANKRANAFAPQVDWTVPESLPPKVDLGFWQTWNQTHRNNLAGLLGEASQHIQLKQYGEAIQLLQQVIKLCPEISAPYPLLASAYRGQGDSDKEYATLQKFAAREASEPAALLRLLELAESRNDWESVKSYANRLAAVNPLIKPAHDYLARAAEITQDSSEAAKALRVLAEMEPLDVAGIRYRLAVAYQKSGSLEQARREVLLALEQAPRFRKAHQLLLKLMSQLENAAVNRTSAGDKDSPSGKPETKPGAGEPAFTPAKAASPGTPEASQSPQSDKDMP